MLAAFPVPRSAFRRPLPPHGPYTQVEGRLPGFRTRIDIPVNIDPAQEKLSPIIGLVHIEEVLDRSDRPLEFLVRGPSDAEEDPTASRATGRCLGKRNMKKKLPHPLALGAIDERLHLGGKVRKEERGSKHDHIRGNELLINRLEIVLHHAKTGLSTTIASNTTRNGQPRGSHLLHRAPSLHCTCQE